MSSTMKAWVYHQTGLPSQVLKLEEVPKPTPGNGEVLVQIKAAGLNPIGYKTMSVVPFSWLQKKPAIPEHDLAGIVAGGDLNGTGFSLGDEVFGIIHADRSHKTAKGSLAEYASVPPQHLAKKPKDISFSEAAGFPLAGLTVLTAMVTSGGLRTSGGGQRVFINGGSSGTGSLAVQVAKAYGHHVTTTCSTDSYNLIKSLKPDVVIDYRSTNLVQELQKTEQPFDIVFDTIGIKDIYQNSHKYLSPSGRYLDIVMDSSTHGLLEHLRLLPTILSRLLPSWLGGPVAKWKFVLLESSTVPKDLKEGLRLLESGDVKVLVDSEHKFENALDAYSRMMSSRAKGKVIVTM